MMEKTDGVQRRTWLIASVVSTCSVLFFFKYFNFFNTNLLVLGKALDLRYPVPVLNIILPIGLSFHTFQSLSYVIEVYRGRQKVERNLGIYALFVMFYPQLVAGPIERPGNLLNQFYEVHRFDYRRVTEGLKLMAWGMVKKVVVADRLAIFVNHVYGAPDAVDGIGLIVATVFFAFQIYCDFSGYSDIAIGAAQVMGFRLMKNFDRPYFAASVAEFWKRWHISLSTWFRDYVYIPLGGSRCGKGRWYANLLVTFTVSGLWHGANWTFVVWGALNGVYLVGSLITAGLRRRIITATGLTAAPALHHAIQVSLTFLLTCVAWVFFRANSLHDACNILSRMITDFTFSPNGLRGHELQATDMLIALLSIVALLLIESSQKRVRLREKIAGMPLLLRWGTYVALGLCILNFGKFTDAKFIYFQF
jgi:D-alanyl-lipoteichoic acid acyltransferase DltB (MBOAT superfamily)